MALALLATPEPFVLSRYSNQPSPRCAHDSVVSTRSRTLQLRPPGRAPHGDGGFCATTGHASRSCSCSNPRGSATFPRAGPVASGGCCAARHARPASELRLPRAERPDGWCGMQFTTRLSNSAGARPSHSHERPGHPDRHGLLSHAGDTGRAADLSSAAHVPGAS